MRPFAFENVKTVEVGRAFQKRGPPTTKMKWRSGRAIRKWRKLVASTFKRNTRKKHATSGFHVTPLAGDMWLATSAAPFSPSVREMTVKLVKGGDMLIGIAPKVERPSGLTHPGGLGWYVYTPSGGLFGEGGARNAPFKHKIERGSVVTVRLDEDFNISFRVNGEDWGVAFSNVAECFCVPLHLSIKFESLNELVQLMQ